MAMYWHANVQRVVGKSLSPCTVMHNLPAGCIIPSCGGKLMRQGGLLGLGKGAAQGALTEVAMSLPTRYLLDQSTLICALLYATCFPESSFPFLAYH